MTRWQTHDFARNDKSGLCVTCNDRAARPWHTVPRGWMRTAEGEVVFAHVDHDSEEVPCEGQRAERALYFEGAWHWFCLTCGAVWLWAMRHSPIRYMRRFF